MGIDERDVQWNAEPAARAGGASTAAAPRRRQQPARAAAGETGGEATQVGGVGELGGGGAAVTGGSEEIRDRQTFRKVYTNLIKPHMFRGAVADWAGLGPVKAAEDPDFFCQHGISLVRVTSKQSIGLFSANYGLLLVWLYCRFPGLTSLPMSVNRVNRRGRAAGASRVTRQSSGRAAATPKRTTRARARADATSSTGPTTCRSTPTFRRVTARSCSSTSRAFLARRRKTSRIFSVERRGRFRFQNRTRRVTLRVLQCAATAKEQPAGVKLLACRHLPASLIQLRILSHDPLISSPLSYFRISSPETPANSRRSLSIVYRRRVAPQCRKSSTGEVSACSCVQKGYSQRAALAASPCRAGPTWLGCGSLRFRMMWRVLAQCGRLRWISRRRRQAKPAAASGCGGQRRCVHFRTPFLSVFVPNEGECRSNARTTAADDPLLSALYRSLPQGTSADTPVIEAPGPQGAGVLRCWGTHPKTAAYPRVAELLGVRSRFPLVGRRIEWPAPPKEIYAAPVCTVHPGSLRESDRLKLRQSTHPNSKIRGLWFYGCPFYKEPRPEGYTGGACTFWYAEEWQRRLADVDFRLYMRELDKSEKWAVEVRDFHSSRGRAGQALQPGACASSGVLPILHCFANSARCPNLPICLCGLRNRTCGVGYRAGQTRLWARGDLVASSLQVTMLASGPR